MKKILLSLLTVGAFISASAQVVSITNQSSLYSQNFDSLANTGGPVSTLPYGWYIVEGGANANTTYSNGNGGSNSGDTYSFGATSGADRALGGLASNNLLPNWGVRMVNNSGSTITQFSFDLFMEQWRAAARTGLDSIYFHYGINNSNSLLGTWTRVPSCDMVSKVSPNSNTALDGNAAANRKYYSFTVTGVSVAVGDTLYLRWQDANVGGTDEGLSIDDFNFTITGTLPVSWASFSAKKSADGVSVKWSTASEINNSGFEVQRSTNGGKSFEAIGFVKGAGNSNRVNNYNFTDADANGNVCYRVKQIDFDGKFNYSKSACVAIEKEVSGKVISTPNPFSGELSVSYKAASEGTSTIQIIDMLGKVHYTASEMVNTGSNSFHINTENLTNGIYFVRIQQGDDVQTQRIIKK